MSVPLFLLENGVVSPTATPPVKTLLQSHPGAYTTFRTHNNGSELVFYERHMRRLANSAKILYESSPKLLFHPGISSTSSSSLQQMKFLEWESKIPSFVNHSMTKAIPYALKERTGETELAFTALVTGNLDKDRKVDEEDIYMGFDMYLHVSLYDPVVFGVKKNGARLAVVGRGRDAANAKYSDWVRIRKALEKLRPPSTTELLLSNDGDQILEAPVSDGVLPGVVREVVIEHVETIRVPSSWDSLSSKTLKEVTWEEKQFEESPGSVTAVIQEEVLKMAKLEGYSVETFLQVM